MSYCAIKWSYKSPAVLNVGLKRSDLAVLRALCWLFNDKDRTAWEQNCYPSIDTLAKLTGLKSSAVNEAKARLLKKKLISWQRAANFNGKQMKPNCYTINCPELQEALKKNEAKRKSKSTHKVVSDDEEVDFRVPALSPGLLYNRPDPESLMAAFPTPLTGEEAKWMADALEFVCDRPENRKALFAALRKSAGLDAYRKALNRVIRTSKSGRQISNRVGYLLKAIKNGK